MDKDYTHDVLIVLGAQVRKEGIPSDTLRSRLALALAKYRERPVPIICCGAQGKHEPCCEGDFMCGWLKAEGVPDTMLISEDRSYDTLENIANARAIMDARGLRHALVVTSDYHLPRALAICRRFRVDARGVGSPSSRRHWIKNHAREILAWGKFFLKME